MRLWPIFEVHQENQIGFDSLGWRQVPGVCNLPLTLIEFLRTSYAKLPRFFPDTLGLGSWWFWMSPMHLLSWESGSSRFCCVQFCGCDFWGLFAKFFKQLELVRLLVKRWQFCGYWLRQLGNSVKSTSKYCKFDVVYQMLEGQQNLVCFYCRKMFSLRNCGWLAERVFFFLPGHFPGGKLLISSWTPVTMSYASAGPKFRVVWIWEMLGSGWGLL